jgi:hypothetical protein
LSLERQIAQLRVLLEYPFEWFLANDSDSLCISPKIPEYLYQEPDVLWSNLVPDTMHVRKADYTWPRLAAQPPYFMHRGIVERLVEVAPHVESDKQTEFIDWAMMAWAVAANIKLKNYRDGVSCPTSDHHSRQHMVNCISLAGAVMLHSVKLPQSLQAMVSARHQWSRAHGRGLSL